MKVQAMDKDKELKEKELENVSGGVNEFYVAVVGRFLKTGLCPNCKQILQGCVNNLSNM